MKVAAVTELKASLSRYLSRVKTGEEIVVTERGKPIAKIIPIPDAETDEEQRLRRLEAQGIIRRGTGKWPPQGFWEAPRLQDPEGELRKLLIEERREGR
jgi:prevent-host-death family protein